MADVKGVNNTIADAPAPSSVLDGGQLGGNVKVMYDSYEADSLASGSTIEVGKELPAGARVLGINLYNDALGTGVTLAVGDSDDADRYLAAASAASAGKLEANLADGIGYAIGTNDGDNQVLITTGGAAATGTIKAVILYSHE